MKKIVFFIMMVGLTSTLSGAIVYAQSSNGYKSIYPSEAKEIIDTEKNVIVLDVRTPYEYKRGHIPNAIVISHTEINEKAEELIPDKQSKILVYCQNGFRAISAAKRLIKLGYTNVYVFGGIINWEYEIVK